MYCDAAADCESFGPVGPPAAPAAAAAAAAVAPSIPSDCRKPAGPWFVDALMSWLAVGLLWAAELRLAPLLVGVLLEMGLVVAVASVELEEVAGACGKGGRCARCCGGNG